MTSMFTRFICRILAAAMVVLPFHAQAGLVGTDQAVATDARATVAGFVARGEVAARLQALGISPEAARARVAALSDAEVAGLAGRIDALPAGGIAGLLPIIAIVLLVYFLIIEPSTAKPAAAKPAAKPAPEKK
jgi:hypothetical protein